MVLVGTATSLNTLLETGSPYHGYGNLLCLWGGAFIVWRATDEPKPKEHWNQKPKEVPTPNTNQQENPEPATSTASKTHSDRTTNTDHAESHQAEKLKDIYLKNKTPENAYALIAITAKACLKRDPTQLTKIIRHIPPNLVDNKSTPLHFALLLERVSVTCIETILAQGIDPLLTDAGNNTFLHLLEKVRQPEYGYFSWSDRPMLYQEEELEKLESLTTKMLENSAALNRQNNAGQIPIMLLAQLSSITLFELAMSKHPDINQTDERGANTLMYAASGGDTQLEHAEQLMKYGADANTKDRNGATALAYAARHGAEKMCALIMASLSEAQRTKQTSLITLDAIESGSTQLLYTLLQKGANPNIADHYASSALRKAIEARQLPMVEHLLQAGANPDQPDIDGVTPTFSAAGSKNKEILFAILQAEGDATTCSTDGRSAMSFAASALWQEGLEMLIAAGGDPTASPKGHTLYMTIARSLFNPSHPDPVRDTLNYLKQFDIPINQKDDFGHSALCYLCGANNYTSTLENEGYKIAAKVFMELGANPKMQCKDGTVIQLAQKNNLHHILKIITRNSTR